MGLYNKMKNYIDWVLLRRSGVKIQWGAKVSSSQVEKSVILSEFSITSNSHIREYTSIGRGSKIYNAKIGKYCSISWDVTVGATNHPLNHLSTHAFPYVPYAGGFTTQNRQRLINTVIGNDVWIGCNSVILPGVTIGNGAVIGAGSVITKDVPPYAIVTGVPAKILKYRFKQEYIEKLLELCWWDLPKEVLIENISLFQRELDGEVLKRIEEKARGLRC